MPEVTVGIPARNEQLSIGDVLSRVCRDGAARQVVVVDDASTDGTAGVALRHAACDRRIVLLSQAQRSGQLAAWRRVAESSESARIVFLDADALPEFGAIARIADALNGAVLSSGRVVPVGLVWPPSRFGAEVCRELRRREPPKETIIGRFFAANTAWFLSAVSRTDVLANDAYLGLLAVAKGDRIRYVDEAIAYYTAVDNFRDFRAQRLRADHGYQELRDMGLLTRDTETGWLAYVRAVAACGVRDPLGAAAWAACQAAHRLIPGRAPLAGGVWDALPSTKRRLET